MAESSLFTRVYRMRERGGQVELKGLEMGAESVTSSRTGYHSFLLHHDLALDLLVDGPEDDVSLKEFFLPLVRAALDDPLNLRFSYAGQLFELFNGGGMVSRN